MVSHSESSTEKTNVNLKLVHKIVTAINLFLFIAETYFFLSEWGIIVRYWYRFCRFIGEVCTNERVSKYFMRMLDYAKVTPICSLT